MTSRSPMAAARALWVRGETHEARAFSSNEVTGADLRPGTINQTGRELDVAIDGSAAVDGELPVVATDADTWLRDFTSAMYADDGVAGIGAASIGAASGSVVRLAPVQAAAPAAAVPEDACVLTCPPAEVNSGGSRALPLR